MHYFLGMKKYNVFRTISMPFTNHISFFPRTSHARAYLEIIKSQKEVGFTVCFYAEVRLHGDENMTCMLEIKLRHFHRQKLCSYPKPNTYSCTWHYEPLGISVAINIIAMSPIKTPTQIIIQISFWKRKKNRK